MRKLIDWPYPDRPKLQQLKMVWKDMRREGLGKTFTRADRWEKAVVLAGFLIGLTASIALTRLIG